MGKKKFSGKFVLRVQASLHEKLVKSARNQNSSLNQYCLQLIEAGLDQKSDLITFSSEMLLLKEKLITKFDKDLMGVLLFGSVIQGRAGKESDLDILIVLSSKIKLNRQLYRWWEEKISENFPDHWSPHFVHLSEHVNQSGSLWLEVGLCHKIIYDKLGQCKKLLDHLNDLIQSGNYQRKFSNGHPYWIQEQV